jgi:hypothetical protein
MEIIVCLSAREAGKDSDGDDREGRTSAAAQRRSLYPKVNA